MTRQDACNLDYILDLIISNWHNYRRDFPWRNDADPWRILLAEILLIQTDADKVSKVWPIIVDRFQNPCDLLDTPQEEIVQLIKPLGLYRWRLSILLKIAQYLKEHFNCNVPQNCREFKGIPGIGDYILAVICIMAYGDSMPVIDTNIARVLYRIILGLEPPKRYMYDKQLRYISSKIRWSRELLLAVIDFASAVCKSRLPRCSSCPVNRCCNFTLKKF